MDICSPEGIATSVATLERARARPCILCGSNLIEIVGAFCPNDHQSYGAPEGKMRFLFYSLCKSCSQDPTVYETVEKVITYELKGTG
jgi:hypothetical protein